ncbi:hypothetical protein GKN94_05425 [Candidatus Lucifugimonas marina]|uniref:ATP-binding protein n=1 Tax=Candidatus Lucifugimonas marina TaxID=3038979 RepID=UPI0027A56367|nr:hypothetical protein GKN94_05425 [SAR202 cluster bacterium JH545]
MPTQSEFTGLDPLSLVQTNENAAETAHKLAISDILSSYHSYFDLFSELLQNSLDALDHRWSQAPFDNPSIRLTIDANLKQVTVVDNGIGMDADTFRWFLAPHHSFAKKKGETRGYKGVGATYLAYGFGAMDVQTKHSSNFEAAFSLGDGRRWAEDDTFQIAKPTTQSIDPFDSWLQTEPSGTAVRISTSGLANEKTTDLSYYANGAEKWANLLRIKTPAGAVLFDAPPYHVGLSVKFIAESGEVSEYDLPKIEYFWAAENFPGAKIQQVSDVKNALINQSNVPSDQLFEQLPGAYKNLDLIWDMWSTDEILDENGDFYSLGEEFRDLVSKHKVDVRADWFHSARMWTQLNDDILKLRKGTISIRGGLQLANDSMPNGELLEIPLTSSIGYGRNCHVVVHFQQGNPDQGRKVFPPELKRIAEQIAVRIVGDFKLYRAHLRSDDSPVNPTAIVQFEQWKSDARQHAENNPAPGSVGGVKLHLGSLPNQEQDVIALFQELVGGQLLKGYKFYGTYSNDPYDSLFDYDYGVPGLAYDSNVNKLGVNSGFTSTPTVLPNRVLEYKNSFDGLIDDFENDSKSPSQIDLVVCWELGNKVHNIGEFSVQSYLEENAGNVRQYHGATHKLRSGSLDLFEILVLSEFIPYVGE